MPQKTTYVHSEPESSRSVTDIKQVTILGVKTGVDKKSHSNLHYAFSIFDSGEKPCYSISHVKVFKDGRYLGNGPDGTALITNPESSLVAWEYYNQMMEVLRSGNEGAKKFLEYYRIPIFNNGNPSD